MSMRIAATAFAVVLAASAGAVGVEAQDYGLAEIHNNSPYTVRGTVEYASAFCSNDDYTVGPGQVWRASSRGACLITGITGGFPGARALNGETMQVVTYTSSGTGYSKFRVEAFGDRYRIFSENEFAQNSRTDARQSPGFRFVNETPWPVAFSLDQVGCLYHDVIPARDMAGQPGVMVRETGAVWFTLRMHIQPDGVNPQTDWDCAEPIVEIVGEVALAAMTGGASAAAAAPKFVAKRVAKEAIKKALKASVRELAKNGRDQIGRYLTETGAISMGGQYAGYDWPFRCDVMPEYRITGGPGIEQDETGEIYLTPGPPFTVTKTNTCGNDMMRASPTSAQAAVDVPGFFTTDEPADMGGGAGGGGGGMSPAGGGGYAGGGQGGGAASLASDGVNGRNLERADHVGGAFRHLGGGRWAEIDGGGNQTYTFEETGRDDWSVYMVDHARGVQIQLDVFRNWIRYAPVGQQLGDLYPITGSWRAGGGGGGEAALASDNVNGHNLARVDHSGGSFRGLGNGEWGEFDPSGTRTYTFAETGRDDWSVYLVDHARGVQIQLDVFRNWIRYAPVGQQPQDLYPITASWRR